MNKYTIDDATNWWIVRREGFHFASTNTKARAELIARALNSNKEAQNWVDPDPMHAAASEEARKRRLLR